MVEAAAEAGADMIKFQSYKAGELAVKNSPSYWDTTKEAATSQYELFQRHDKFGVEEYVKLAARCRELGVLFGSTLFDPDFVEALGGEVPAFKLASADINNFILLEKICIWKKPVLLSAGASTLDEVGRAVAFIRERGIEEIGVMHCILEYPTDPAHSNLDVIATLNARYPDLSIGWSDHVPPEPMHLCQTTAWLLGAEIIEKHFTLDKTKPGNDHYHAWDPGDVKSFLALVERISVLRGDGEKVVYPWEANSRRYARRSLVAARDIEAGAVIEFDMLAAKRPGQGISPDRFKELVGRKTRTRIEKDQPLSLDDLI
jgi:N-acetylneuraminate synthase